MILERIKRKLSAFMIRQSEHYTDSLDQKMNWDEARKVIFLYSVLERDEESLIRSYLKKVSGKEVIRIQYYPSKKLPDGRLQIENDLIYCRKDVNFFLKPGKDKIKQSLEQESDILIVLNDGGFYPVFVAAAICKAKIKISLSSSEWDSLFDMKLSQDTDSLKERLDSLDHYLTLIQKS